MFQNIENTKGKKFSDYQDEFEYLISAGISLDVNAISNPVFPLSQSVGKNLLKLYLNDVGLLTSILYQTNAQAILKDDTGINLGSVVIIVFPAADCGSSSSVLFLSYSSSI